MTFKDFLKLFEAERSPIIVDYLEPFKDSYKEFVHIEGVRDNLKEFFECKKQWPQKLLLSSFKDHKLTGEFFEKNKIMECHLSGDVLMLYIFDNHILRMCICCDHNTLKGGRSKSLQKLLKQYL